MRLDRRPAMPIAVRPPGRLGPADGVSVPEVPVYLPASATVRSDRLSRQLARAVAVRSAGLSRPTIQRTQADAEEFIKENNIKFAGAVSKKHVTAWVKDESNDAALRAGLLAAWNKDAGKGQIIKITAPETRQGGIDALAVKVEREKGNKARGDKRLRDALDQYEREGYVGIVAIGGFRICSYGRRKKGKGGIAVAVSRATGREESAMMKAESAIQRRDRADPYKWFSESQAHTEKFVNYGSSDVGKSLIIWLDAEQYLKIRTALEHEFLSAHKAANRFHQESVSSDHLINLGIHPECEGEFESALIDVADLPQTGKITIVDLDVYDEQPGPSLTSSALSSSGSPPLLSLPQQQSASSSSAAAVPSITLHPQELLYAHAAGYSHDVGSWRGSDEFEWFQQALLDYGSPLPLIAQRMLLARYRA